MIMQTTKNQHDCPRWTKDYQRLTKSDHHIECMAAFGHCNRKENDPPLVKHIHLNCLEVTIMLKGTQVFEVDGKKYDLLGNQIFVTLPNVPHSSAGVPQLQAEFYYFQINLLDYTSILGLDTQNTRYLINELMKIREHVFKGNKAINALATNAFQNLSTRDQNLRCCAQAQIVSLLYMLCDIVHHPEPVTVTPFVVEVTKHIQRNLMKDISLEDLSKDFGYSLSYFKAKFRAEAGITPMHYINVEKIELAKQLLLQNKSVTETAMLLSFNSSNYFSTLFRRFTSYTPSEYQKLFSK